MTDQDPRSHYIDYVQNILGVKTIMRDPSEAVVGVGPNHFPLVVRVQGLASYSAAENDLLGKMLAALKLDPSLYKIVESGGEDEQGVSAVLFLEFADERTEVTDRVLTYSPRTLLKKPDLKKVAWADLQKIIAAFARP